MRSGVRARAAVLCYAIYAMPCYADHVLAAVDEPALMELHERLPTAREGARRRAGGRAGGLAS